MEFGSAFFLKDADTFVNIGSDGLAIANQLEGVESVVAAFDFLDMADGAIQQLAKIPHG